MNFYLILPIVASVICFILAFLVLTQNVGRLSHRLYWLFSFLLACWALFIFFMRSSPDPEHALPWERAVMTASLFASVAFFHFCCVYTGTRLKKWIVLSMYLLVAAYIAIAPTSLVVRGISEDIYGFLPLRGPLFLLNIGATYFFAALGLIALFKASRSATSPEIKNRFVYLAIGILCFFIGGATDIISIVNITIIPPLGLVGNILLCFITAIAILRYHLLDIRLIIKKGLIYFVTIGLLITAYATVLFIISQYLERVLGVTFWRNFLVLLFIAIALYPVFMKSRGRVDRWFYREKYNHLEIIEHFSDEIKSTMDLNLLVSSLLDVVVSVLKSERACLMLPDTTGANFVPSACRGIKLNSLRGLSGDSVLVLWLSRNDGFLSRRDIDIIPQFRGLTFRERAMLDEMKMNLIISLKKMDKLSGILILGAKLSEQEYSEDDLMMLRVVCRQAAVSLDNARLFKEVEDSLLELKRVQEQLVRSERSMALGEMAAGVAHDFNNILAAILGRAQLALDDATDERVRKGLKIIEQAALDGAKTVRRLQDFTRVRADHHFELVDINEVVNKTLQLVEPRLKEYREAKGKAIELNLSLGQVEPVMGEQGELVEVLVNIINNGIDAISGSGRLEVCTRQGGNDVIITVSDTGAGIPDNVKNRIGDPYFSTKGSSGMGLGLSVAYGIINRHGGSISFDSTVGKGTVFYIKLPVVSEEKVQEDFSEVAEEKNVNSALLFKKAKILVVDDDERIREYLKMTLLQLGYEVTIADNGEQGITRLNDGDYDLVITDLGMPNVSGWEVAKAVKKQVSVIPVIMITGWGVQIDIEKARLDGVDEVLTKPFTREGLNECIIRLLSRADSRSA